MRYWEVVIIHYYYYWLLSCYYSCGIFVYKQSFFVVIIVPFAGSFVVKLCGVLLKRKQCLD